MLNAPINAPTSDTRLDSRGDTAVDIADVAGDTDHDAGNMTELDAEFDVGVDAWLSPDAGTDVGPSHAEPDATTPTTCSLTLSPNPVAAGGTVTGTVVSNGATCAIMVRGITLAIPACNGSAALPLSSVPAGTYMVFLVVDGGPGGPTRCSTTLVIR